MSGQKNQNTEKVFFVLQNARNVFMSGVGGLPLVFFSLSGLCLLFSSSSFYY